MEVKDRILQKAEELFKRYGIRSVTMDELSTQLGVSKKTIYQYFADKDELVAAVIENEIDRSRAYCVDSQQVADNAVHEIMMAMENIVWAFADMNPTVFFDLQRYHFKLFEKLQCFKDEFMCTMVIDNLKRGIAEGLYRADMDVEVLARLRVASTMKIAFDQDVFPNVKFSLFHIQKELLKHFLYGVVTPEGYVMIQQYREKLNLAF